MSSLFFWVDKEAEAITAKARVATADPFKMAVKLKDQGALDSAKNMKFYSVRRDGAGRLRITPKK